MKISNSFNANFSALFGKKVITTLYKRNGELKTCTTQHIHPFKNEFQTEEDKNKWLEDFKKTSFYNYQIKSSWGMEKEYNVIIEPALPFSKAVFEKAKKDGVQLLPNPDDFYSVTTRNIGYFPSVTFDNGNFDCIV